MPITTNTSTTRTVGGNQNRECFWPNVCQESPKWAHLAPRKFRQADRYQRAIGEATGRPARSPPWHGRRHDLDRLRYHCVIGITSEDLQTARRSSVASITSPTRTEMQPFPSPATGLTSLRREIFEAFARPVRRASSSTLCSRGAWRKLSQSADFWRSFCAWWPKRRFFSSSKMRTSLPGEWRTRMPYRNHLRGMRDPSDEVAPSAHSAQQCCLSTATIALAGGSSRSCSARSHRQAQL